MNRLRMRWTFWKKRRFQRRLRVQQFTDLGVHLYMHLYMHLCMHLSVQPCMQRGHRHAAPRCL